MAETTETEIFDPAGYTVDGVNEYLETAEPDEVARVLAAESATDKPRKGIVDGPHAAVPEEATPEELLGEQDPYEMVRAKDATSGAEYTTTRIAAINAGSKVLAKRAMDDWGYPVPTKTVLDLRVETNAEADSQPGTDHEEN